uniref:Major facilitator superfamily (MFS) profile domain-containing protein n=1 Tax=Bracon brevicornis TaxID=1563983 RepID=A0A6V7IVX4_9HYME
MLYTVPIFDAAQISIDSYLAAIIIGVMQLIGISLSTAIIEQTGRRPLLFISSTGVILCHAALGTFFLLQSSSIDLSSFGWLPVVAMSTFAIIYSIGLGPMYFTVSNEAYHPDAASFCSSVSFFIMELSGFFLAKFYPIIGAAIGLHYCFFILVIFCICILLAIIVYVPETKGRTKESILDELRSRRGIFH